VHEEPVPTKSIKTSTHRVSIRGVALFAPSVLLFFALVLPGCGGDPGRSSGSPNPPESPNPSGSVISESFFDMHMHTGVLGLEPWPTASFASIRLWNTGTAWSEINTSEGTYDWTEFDKWLAIAQAHGVSSLLYTFGWTPTWASSNPSDATCHNTANGLGQCWPPNDLNSDGSGSDQHWKDFVTALVTHNANSTTAHVRYWEIWNEFDQLITWKGTNAQLVRLAQDARAIILNADPKAIVLTPSSSSGLTGVAQQMKAYLATPGASDAADAIAIHPYVQQPDVLPAAEDVVTLITNVKQILTGPDATKPIWSTEGSWGVTSSTGFTDPDQQAAFTARYLLLQLSSGIRSFYWYEWNNVIDGTLWNPMGTAGCSSPAGCVTQSGVAYQQVFEWTVGNSLTSPCAAQGTIWTCQFSGSNGYLAEAVWDTSQSCNAGVCTSTAFSVPTQFTQFRDLSGTSVSLNGATTITIGAKPNLLQNQ
jgi:hypothetical protein